MLVKALLIKSRLHCIDIIADHCSQNTTNHAIAHYKQLQQVVYVKRILKQ